MFTLILVLWAVAVSSILAFNVNYSTSWGYQAARTLADKVRYYPEALTVLKLALPYAGKEFKVGDSFNITVGVDTWKVFVEDGGSGINPNKLKEEDWRDLLELCGVEEGEKMSVLIDSFMDWVDADSYRRLNGAEDEYYEEQGLPYRPRNAPILDVRELMFIRGFKDVYPCLRPLLNMHGTGKISLKSATRAQLKSLGLGDEDVERVLELQREDRKDKSTKEEWENFYNNLPEEVKRWVTLSHTGTVRLTLEFRGVKFFFLVGSDGKVEDISF